jgi:hypothetical protein
MKVRFFDHQLDDLRLIGGRHNPSLGLHICG